MCFWAPHLSFQWLNLKEEMYEIRVPSGGVEGLCRIIVLREDGGWGFVALKYFHSYNDEQN